MSFAYTEIEWLLMRNNNKIIGSHCVFIISSLKSTNRCLEEGKKIPLADAIQW